MRILVTAAAVLCLVVGTLSAIGGQDPAGLPSNSPPQIPAGVSDVPAGVLPGAEGLPVIPSNDRLDATPSGEYRDTQDEPFDCVLMVRDNEIVLLSEAQWKGKPVALSELGANLGSPKRVLINANPTTPMALVRRIVEVVQQAGAEMTLRGQAGVDVGTQEPLHSDIDSSQMKIFDLQFARAQELVETLRQLYSNELGRGLVVFAHDATSNKLIVRGANDKLGVIEAIVLALDKRAENPLDGAAASTSTAVREGQPATGLLPSGVHTGGGPAAGNIDQLTADFAQIEQQLANLSRQVQSVAANSQGFDDVTRKEMEHRIRNLVQAAFEARQQLQQAELTELRQRLAHIEQQISSRDRIKAEIINSRVQELFELPPSTTDAAQNHPLQDPVKPTVAHLKWHGVTVVPVDAKEFAAASPNQRFRGGLKIISVQDASPAANAQLRPNDILVGLGKWETTSLRNLDYALHHSTDGHVTFTIIRDGNTMQGLLEVKMSSGAEKSSELPDSQGRTGESVGTMTSYDTRASLILRTPSEFQKAIADAEAEKVAAQLIVDTRLEDLRSRNLKGEKVDSATIEDLKRFHPAAWKALETAGARLQLVRDEYATQLKLLELELKSAEQILETTHGQHDVSKTLYEAGRIGSIDILRAKLEWDSATARVDRAKTLLDLYRKLETKPDAKAELPLRTEGTP